MSKLISVVVPAFNEEACVDELAARLRTVADNLSAEYAFEFIIVENGSMDMTYAHLLAIRQADSRFKIIRFSRNFGMEGAVTAGLRKARGDAAVIMCADLQDPPEMIEQFLTHLEQGYDNIYGQITKRSDEGWLRQRLTHVFYALLHRANGGKVPKGVSDFRMVSKRMYTVLNALPERHRMLRAMWGWIGFKSIGVGYERPPRHGGKSTYALFRNIYFALHGIAASTTTPLKLIPMAGLTLSALSFISLIAMAVSWIVGGVPFNGFGTIVALQLGLFGLLFLLLGVLSEYVGMIFEEVRARPMYVLDTTHGFQAEEEVSTNGHLVGSYTPMMVS
jgi:glycosyltransferase involved in cell wall biosynthesis